MKTALSVREIFNTHTASLFVHHCTILYNIMMLSLTHHQPLPVSKFLTVLYGPFDLKHMTKLAYHWNKNFIPLKTTGPVQSGTKQYFHYFMTASSRNTLFGPGPTNAQLRPQCQSVPLDGIKIVKLRLFSSFTSFTWCSHSKPPLSTAIDILMLPTFVTLATGFAKAPNNLNLSRTSTTDGKTALQIFFCLIGLGHANNSAKWVGICLLLGRTTAKSCSSCQGEWIQAFAEQCPGAQGCPIHAEYSDWRRRWISYHLTNGLCYLGTLQIVFWLSRTANTMHLLAKVVKHVRSRINIQLVIGRNWLQPSKDHKEHSF